MVFRIIHRDNLAWILANGLHCRQSALRDPNFVPIGLADLIDRRHLQPVPRSPWGTMSNYVPFYFTPLSPMAYRIKTGWNVKQRDNTEIIILAGSLKTFLKDGVVLLFSDRHASTVGARFSGDLKNLDWIDWSILQRKDFKRDNEDLGKTDRYQAEALVHNHAPPSSLLGLATYDNNTKMWAEQLVRSQGLSLKVIQKSGWYF